MKMSIVLMPGTKNLPTGWQAQNTKLKTLMVINLSEQHSLVSNWVSELRNVDVQQDRLRFRLNLERIAEVIG